MIYIILINKLEYFINQMITKGEAGVDDEEEMLPVRRGPRRFHSVCVGKCN